MNLGNSNQWETRDEQLHQKCIYWTAWFWTWDIPLWMHGTELVLVYRVFSIHLLSSQIACAASISFSMHAITIIVMNAYMMHYELWRKHPARAQTWDFLITSRHFYHCTRKTAKISWGLHATLLLQAALLLLLYHGSSCLVVVCLHRAS